MERKPDYHVGSKTASDCQGHAPDSKGNEEISIQLRAIEEEDLRILAYWRNQASIRECCREYRLLNIVNQRDWYEKMSRDRATEMFVIVTRSVTSGGDMGIGVCGLTNINWKDRHAEVSIYIGTEDYLGKGYGTLALERLSEIAFGEYGLHRLYAEIYDFNGPSMYLFSKCGYKQEGTMRDAVWGRGMWWDSHIYGLLAGEWDGTIH